MAEAPAHTPPLGRTRKQFQTEHSPAWNPNVPPRWVRCHPPSASPPPAPSPRTLALLSLSLIALRLARARREPGLEAEERNQDCGLRSGTLCVAGPAGDRVQQRVRSRSREVAGVHRKAAEGTSHRVRLGPMRLGQECAQRPGGQADCRAACGDRDGTVPGEWDTGGRKWWTLTMPEGKSLWLARA